jgi:hypothetical protein
MFSRTKALEHKVACLEESREHHRKHLSRIDDRTEVLSRCAYERIDSILDFLGLEEITTLEHTALRKKRKP